jgi:hypothetical protein
MSSLRDSPFYHHCDPQPDGMGLKRYRPYGAPSLCTTPDQITRLALSSDDLLIAEIDALLSR